VFGWRAGQAALQEPEVKGGAAAPGPGPSPVPPPETRHALWMLAGIERTREDLERLADDPFPLARLIAASALAREESRGAHQRADHPDTDPALDRRHLVVPAGNGARWEGWR
jgi:L-aspartate oxidase